jgi:N-acetylmuramic acid 6-phosphate etherase
MVDMQPSNAKLMERGQRMIIDATGASDEAALKALKFTGNVRDAIKQIQDNAHA